jgi:replicative DNA helicase
VGPKIILIFGALDRSSAASKNISAIAICCGGRAMPDDGDDPAATGNVVPIGPPRTTPLGDLALLRLERIPPYNPEAEQAVLGSLLINNATFDGVADFLQPGHFGNAMHGRIFAAIGKLVERGGVANPITLRTLFDQDGALAEIGGAQYLARLAANAPMMGNAEDYGRAVHDLHLRRELIGVGEDIVNHAFKADLDDPAGEQLARAEARLYALAETGRADRGFSPFDGALDNAIRDAETAFKRGGGTVGVATGLVDLDLMLGGLHRSDLVILAGRPSMGKTALATNIAFYATDANHAAKVGFFSLEMSATQLARRILGEVSGVGSDRIRRGELAREHFAGFLEVQRQIKGRALEIDDTPALSVAALRSRARRLKRRKGLDLLVVDYVQLLQPVRLPGSRGPENRVQEVAEITRGLKALAKELEVPVLALSQLSRAVESREDKRPILADLRESGAIEQDADVVMFIYREEYYRSRAEPTRRDGESTEKFNDRHVDWSDRCAKVRNLAEIIIAKQRHGPTGIVKLHFDHQTTRFSNVVG